MNTPSLIRAAAVVLWATAGAFGLAGLGALRNLLTGRDLPMIVGFRAYGGGQFERLGSHAMVALLGGFLLVCILEGVAGCLLWGNHKSGAILALALVPVGAVFWWGFALPFPPMLAVLRTLLIVLGWRSLT